MKDCHIHSGLIEHTEDGVLTIAKKAKQLGFTEITILEHFSPFKVKFPGNSDSSNTLFVNKISPKYKRRTSTIPILIKQCKDAEKKLNIKIKKSLEIDYYPDYEKDIKKLNKFELDYLTLGCHYVEDPKANEKNKLLHIGFKENRDYFLKKYNKDLLLKLYYKNILNGVKSGLFSIVAHLEFLANYLDYKPKKIFPLIEPIFKEMIKRDVKLEINIQRPSIEPINFYKKLGGKLFVIGSDSHSIQDLEKSIEKRRRLADKIKGIGDLR